MREANKRAAAAAFQANNRAGVRDSDTVDLHDLYVEEALGCLRTRLGEARQEARLLAGLPALLLAGRCATVQQLCAHEAQASLLDLPCGKVDATLYRVKVALGCRTRSLALCVMRRACAKLLHGLLPAGLHLSPCTASGRRRVVTWNGDASLHVLWNPPASFVAQHGRAGDASGLCARAVGPGAPGRGVRPGAPQCGRRAAAEARGGGIPGRAGPGVRSGAAKPRVRTAALDGAEAA